MITEIVTFQLEVEEDISAANSPARYVTQELFSFELAVKASLYVCYGQAVEKPKDHLGVYRSLQ